MPVWRQEPDNNKLGRFDLLPQVTRLSTSSWVSFAPNCRQCAEIPNFPTRENSKAVEWETC